MSREGGKKKRRKKTLKKEEMETKKTLVCETKGKTGWNRWLYLSSLLRGNTLWLSNQLQTLCRKSSHMKGTMTHSSLRSLRFLHAFLFWGLLMNDLKSDLFLSLGCLRGRQLRGGGGVWIGWEDPRMKVSCLLARTQATASLFSSRIKHGSYISFMRASAKLSWNRILFNRGWKVWRICGETILLCSVVACELENNIYKASHLTSFITKSHNPASPMKLGVNPSSASLFSSSPSTPDPGLYLPSSHLRSAKDTKENFGVIQKKWRQFPTSKSP